MDRTYAVTHAEEDRAHWWFRGRLAVLVAVLRATLPRRRLTLVELGCGTGNVLDALGEFGDLVGVERDERLRAIALAHGLDVRAGALPDRIPLPPRSADVVLLLDVLEHVDDEAAALAAARALLAADGRLVVSVPAYRWLWSAHDVHLGHRRRYSRGELVRAVESAGFTVEHASYFNTLLFPGVVAVRAVNRLVGWRGHDLHRPPAMLNRVFAWAFALERFVVPRAGLPAGGSLVLVARA